MFLKRLDEPRNTPTSWAQITFTIPTLIVIRVYCLNICAPPHNCSTCLLSAQIYSHHYRVLVLPGWSGHVLLLSGAWVAAAQLLSLPQTKDQGRTEEYRLHINSLWLSPICLQSEWWAGSPLWLFLISLAVVPTGAVSPGTQLCCLWKNQVQKTQVSYLVML